MIHDYPRLYKMTCASASGLDGAAISDTKTFLRSIQSHSSGHG